MLYTRKEDKWIVWILIGWNPFALGFHCICNGAVLVVKTSFIPKTIEHYCCLMNVLSILQSLLRWCWIVYLVCCSLFQLWPVSSGLVIELSFTSWYITVLPQWFSFSLCIVCSSTLQYAAIHFGDDSIHWYSWGLRLT
jgi:hypothetical protein